MPVHAHLLRHLYLAQGLWRAQCQGIFSSITRRASLHSLTATVLLAATPALARAAAPAPPEAAETLCRLLSQYRKARQFEAKAVAERDLYALAAYRSSVIEIQEQITELLLAQPQLLAVGETGA